LPNASSNDGAYSPQYNPKMAEILINLSQVSRIFQIFQFFKNNFRRKTNEPLKKVQMYEPSAGFDYLLKSLKAQGALKTAKDSTSRKIGGSRLRFYATKLAKLR